MKNTINISIYCSIHHKTTTTTIRDVLVNTQYCVMVHSVKQDYTVHVANTLKLDNVIVVVYKAKGKNSIDKQFVDVSANVWTWKF